MDNLELALQKAFINKETLGDELTPKFIVNNPKKHDYLLNTLSKDLKSCKTFFIAVAFITPSGLNAIKTQLADLALRGISGKILTSTYLNFNDPHVFRALLNIPNVEVRVSKKEGFHSKGYLFEMEDYQSFVIGSSNLTMSALKLNYEWNVRLTSRENGEMVSSIQKHLIQEWHEAQSLTLEWVDAFEKNYHPIVNRKMLVQDVSENECLDTQYILPNSMQKEALRSLKALRETGATKGMIVSATGTGKTYLAAFDVQQFHPKRVLFIVHSELILMKALESFKLILGGKDDDYGVLSGNSKNFDAKYLFGTIQTVSKSEYQERLGKEAFDYILIDEVHKAGAKSYIKAIEFFNPKFLLGMTATPERTDNFNIFELFDYNVAYEIRLQAALEAELLCPFYYFGVTDYEKDGEIIDETTDLKRLLQKERVDFLIKKINYYGYSGDSPRGLVFCSRKDEARQLAEMFNDRGIPGAYLSGDHNFDKREKEIKRLDTGEIHYIFTVDIFNEGIDIPKVNQVIMLRNTQSSIIFIQQLGRGLRKDPSKEFVTVIDFIGNYKNNYMIPMALSGDSSQTKNSLRRDTIDVTYISGLSSINFEKVARERIFKSIDQAKLDAMSELKASYFKLKNRLNRVPYLNDFQVLDGVDPLLIIGKEKTYYNFLERIGETEAKLSEEENGALKFVSVELLSGIRPHELYVIEEFLMTDKEQLSLEEITALFDTFNLTYTTDTLASVVKVLDLSFYESTIRKRYLLSQMFKMKENCLQITEKFREFKKNSYFINLMLDVIHTGINKSMEYDLSQPLNLYKKYRRKDVLRLLNMNFNQNEQSIGGYTNSNNHFAIFVTLDKGKDFKAARIAYEDEFIDERTFHWYTKAPRNLRSPEVQLLRNPGEYKFHLFVKRKYNQKENETDFYYLGEVAPLQETIQQVEKQDKEGKKKSVVKLDFTLETPVEPNMYEFLTQNTN
ncbi:TPA: DEAD/DEAH box helicase [Enterococcus faecalis]|nr:DEAD/DEAH box helicase [Enterococcus faecalis]